MEKLSVILLLIIGLSFTGYGQDKDSIVYEFVTDPMPTYPGGNDSLHTFLEKNMEYSGHYSGKIYIQFNVNEDGSLSDFEIVKSTCEPCNKKVMEAFKKMPNWIPAKRKNIPVKTKMTIPVKFGLYSN